MRDHNCMQIEMAFYGKGLKALGRYYYRPREMAAAYPDLLFFCLYAARLLVTKKLSLPTAREMQKCLAIGNGWEKVLNLAEDRPFSLPFQAVDYRGLTVSGFSAGMITGKSVHFRLGYCGFGFFTNRRAFNRCAASSVFALLDLVYRRNEQDDRFREMLWQVAMSLGRLEFGRELNSQNWFKAAQRVYVEITQDFFPGSVFAPPKRRNCTNSKNMG